MAWADLANSVLTTAIATFKTAAVYTPVNQDLAPVNIDGVFDIPNQIVDPNTGAAVDTFQPTFGIRIADLSGPPEFGDRILINAKNYRVIEVREDTQGGATLVLNKQG